MTDNPNTPGDQKKTSEAWQEVGRQFKTLGESISQAFRTAWQDEENRRRMEEMRSGLESMVREVGRTIDETAKSPAGQQLRSDAEQAAAKIRDAGEQTVQEIRPHLLDALRQVNAELQKLADRMESHQDEGPKGGGPTNP
jgi:hypothetical protein